MKVLSNDNRFEEVYNERVKIENAGGVNMCEVLDRFEACGEAHSKEQIVINMLKDNASIEQIIKWTGVTEERVKELQEKLMKDFLS